MIDCIAVARGCTGCTCTPRAEKKFGGQIYRGNFVSAPQAESAPPRQSKSPIFEKIGGDLGGGRGYLGSFSVRFESDD